VRVLGRGEHALGYESIETSGTKGVVTRERSATFRTISNLRLVSSERYDGLLS
jgi:hypothetical protein